jgi:heme exporter protein B
MREVLLPVLLFPVSVPIVIGAAEATRLLFDENPDTGPGVWIRVLVVFAVVFLAVSWLTFEYVIEE